MAHTSTGESPAQRMFNRQIRSRLDLFTPSNVTSHQKAITNNKFNIGDRVSVRDYYDKKYQFGRIYKILGELHYNIKLDDGRVWKRHLEQIHRIGEGIPEPPAEFPNEPSNEFIVPQHTYVNQPQLDTRTHTHTPTPTSTPLNTSHTPTTPYHTAPNTNRRVNLLPLVHRNRFRNRVHNVDVFHHNVYTTIKISIKFEQQCKRKKKRDNQIVF